MKSLNRLAFIMSFTIMGCAHAQKKTSIEADPRNWTARNGEVTFKETGIQLVNKGDIALLWIKDMDFQNGTIELDIKGKNESGNSFLGLAFHGLNDTTYDAVYFRPFNFNSEEKKGNSIQYIDAPGNEWHVLRKKFPGKYESSISPVPNPDDWFHVKFQIDFPFVRVYVNDAEKPTFEVEQISKRMSGKLGLWIDSDEGWFRNIRVTKKDL